MSLFTQILCLCLLLFQSLFLFFCLFLSLSFSIFVVSSSWLVPLLSPLSVPLSWSVSILYYTLCFSRSLPSSLSLSQPLSHTLSSLKNDQCIYLSEFISNSSTWHSFSKQFSNSSSIIMYVKYSHTLEEMTWSEILLSHVKALNLLLALSIWWKLVVIRTNSAMLFPSTQKKGSGMACLRHPPLPASSINPFDIAWYINASKPILVHGTYFSAVSSTFLLLTNSYRLDTDFKKC